MAHEELLKRITARPEVFGGKPIIRDMRLGRADLELSGPRGASGRRKKQLRP